MAKVYLVQEVPLDRETFKPKFDLTPALKYGEIVVISKRLAQMQFSPGPLILEINQKLKDFNPDLRQDAPDQSDIIDPQKLSEELEKLRSIQSQILEAENKIKELKSDEKVQSGIVIPKLMEEMNLSTLKLKDGSEVSVKKIYSATIKAEKKAEALQWLRNNGLGDIIKNNITVTFGQGEENKAMAYATLAKGQGYEPSQEEKVHAGTLKVTMEDWKNKGNEVPEDLFWTFDGNQTKIKGKK